MVKDDDCTFLGQIVGEVQMWIRPGIFEQDHRAIGNVARQSPVGATFLKAAAKWIEDAYAEGRVRVLIDREPDGTQRCVGFTVSKAKAEETAVFLIAVDENVRRKGCGRELLADVQKRSEARRLTSTLPKSCAEGLAFSAACGFYEHGRTAKGGVRLRLDEW